MDKFLFAIGMVLSLSLHQPARSSELSEAESKIDEISERDEFTEDVEAVAALPIQGEEQAREANLPPGKVAQPRRHVSDQIDVALDSLNEKDSGSAPDLESELAKLNAAQAIKEKRIAKKLQKKKVTKNQSIKKSTKADVKKAAQKKKVSMQRLGSKKRMIASLPRELPKKR